jgi:enoyl-CoA hydratase/carnithine racemase
MNSQDSPMPFSAEQCASFPQAKLVYLQANEKDHVLEIRLNRPDKRNAFDPVLVRELAWALSYAHHQKNVWVVVLAANGPVFCAGADLKAFAGMGTPDPGSEAPQLPADTPIGDLFRHLHKPCIARVHGDVLAGGFLLIGGCTHVLAAETARFGLPEVRRGIWPMQVMATLAELMPARELLDWCMRGLLLDARQAQAKGLVTQVCPAEELDAALDALLQDLLAQSPSAIRLGLQAWDNLRRIEPAGQHRFLQGMLAQVLQTADAREGLAAFREKRDPVWTGE